MLAVVSTGLLVAGFAGAGLFNAIGTDAVRRDFSRWGYPTWWNRATGALEIASAILIASPLVRIPGLALGAVIIAAAALTVLFHREFKHLVPVGIFAGLLVLAVIPT